MPKPGDTVLFHLIPKHVCGGGEEPSVDVIAYRRKIRLTDKPEVNECRCSHEAQGIREATVLAVCETEPGDDRVYLDLEVMFSDEEMEIEGFARIQTSVVEATTTPPESGTWTAVASKKAASALARASIV